MSVCQKVIAALSATPVTLGELCLAAACSSDSHFSLAVIPWPGVRGPVLPGCLISPGPCSLSAGGELQWSPTAAVALQS